MATFKYRAINSAGEKYKGVKDSLDKFSLYAELKEGGSTLISAQEATYKRSVLNSIMAIFNSVPEHQKITFSKNLGSMIGAGLPLAKSLEVLQKQIQHKYFKIVISKIEEEISKGKTLSEVAAAYPEVFPNLFVSMVKAGEESGTLSNSLKIVGEQLDTTFKLKKKIKGAMVYPAIILSVMIVIGVLMLIFVVPSITAVFKDVNVELPFMTRVLINMSDFLKNNILISIVLAFFAYMITYFYLKTKIGKRMSDWVFLHLPVISNITKETNAARITRTLSSLLNSGVPYSESIMITSEVIQNHYFKELLNEARVKVEKGENISAVFLKKDKLCPIFVGEMMNVGEETGNMPSMLLEVAMFYETSVDQKTKDMSTIIEPFLMVFIGIAVGFFAFAMIKPIYSVMDTI